MSDTFRYQCHISVINVSPPTFYQPPLQYNQHIAISNFESIFGYLATVLGKRKTQVDAKTRKALIVAKKFGSS